MNLSVPEDFVTLLESLDKVIAGVAFETMDAKRSAYSARLDQAVAESGLLDAAGMDAFGLLAGALLTERLARLPAVMEAAASAVIRPVLCPDSPRPLAVVAGRPSAPVRFLGQARAVLFIGEAEARLVEVGADDRTGADDFFASPAARLVAPEAVWARGRAVGTAQEARRLHAIATACEIAGALGGAIDAVTEYVSNRRQFGRPIGAFQAVQHRLAQAATETAAARLLALKAADLGGGAEAFAACGYVQDRAARIAGDLHQFMGATGLTLEHPLYRWTYRVRLLLSEMGGAHRQYLALSERLWNTDGEVTDAGARHRRAG